MLKWLANLFFETSEKKLRSLQSTVDKINSLEESLKGLTDEQLKGKTAEFRKRLSQGETLEEILPETFALIRETSTRTIGLRHFDVQLIGGIVLHQGKIAEMKTGEGKTLVATLPLYLNALTGRGANLITVNDYLAKRDRNWMGPIFEFLGLSVGVIQHDLNYEERKKAYACDITYGTNNEFGFDYLRDNMAVSIEQCVQRELNYAIVDEVDSILIDEARTPLIISGVVEENLEGYYRADQIVRRLQKEVDFSLDEKTKNAVLTEEGIGKIEKNLNLESLYDVVNLDLTHQIVQSLKAWHLFKRDIDYVIKDQEIVIVDEFTGRLMFGRRYSDGLHQAIEAKEKVKIREESQTLATITFQNYFRLYRKLAGMTGTALTEEAEFGKIYNLEVLDIPTHKPLIRKDQSDIIYKTRKEKFKAITEEIIDLNQQGQPVLVGTISIENSEVLSELLRRKGVAHQVLNAKHHEREAEIISQAGQPQAVTIATNMAGRGTDIVLGQGVVGLGGLNIIGSERHESRRIDNQLRGRSGRQGDPGSSRFYVSLEDDLMRLFGSQRIAGIMDRLGIEENTPIEHTLISRAIENAQKKVEQYHFSIRKQLLEYDDVMNKQRRGVYELRRRILEGKDLKAKMLEIIEETLADLIAEYFGKHENAADGDQPGFIKILSEILPLDPILLKEIENQRQLAALREFLIKIIHQNYTEREKLVGEASMRELEKLIMLKVLDTKWIEQLHNMDALREGIGLRAYGQRDPLIEYKMEGYGMFQAMMRSFREEITGMIFKVQILKEGEIPKPLKPKKAVTFGSQENKAQTAVRKDQKIGRNHPCPCGSGKKYKRCCGA